MSDDRRPAAWARDAVRRLIRTEIRKLAARLDRESRDLERWLQKTAKPDAPLGYRPPADFIGPPAPPYDDQAPR